MQTQILFKILKRNLFDEAIAKGVFSGASIDLSDGYIHLSSETQVRETAKLHFAEQTDLVLIAIAAQSLGKALRWEASRGGALFPHFYGTLNPQQFLWTKPLPWNGTSHDFPHEVTN